MRARVLTLIVLLAMSAAAVAQVQTYPWYNSFRNQSTAGLLEDDLDLMLGSYGYLDPARIVLIDGNRLYTNLANIYNKNEEQFNNSGAETYVVGGAADIFGYGKLGLLYSKYTQMERDSLTWTNVYLEDTDPLDPNNVYDLRGVEEYQEQQVETWDENNYYLGWAKQINDMKVGVAFNRNQYSHKYDSFWRYGYDENNTITGALLYTEAESDTESYHYEDNINMLGTSIWKPLNDKMDVSLRLAIGFGGSTGIDEGAYSFDQSSPGGASYNETEDYNYNADYSGFAFSGGGAYVYKWNNNTDTRLDLQYTHSGYKPEAGIVWEYNYHYQLVNPVTNSTYYDENYTSTPEGDNTEDNIDFRAVHRARLNRAVFAIGFGLSTGNYNQLYTYDRSETSVERYNELNDPALYASYVETSTWNELWEVSNAADYLDWSFPVCVEFDLTKNIVFRLGAKHTITNSSYTYSEVMTSGSEMVTTVRTTGTGVTTTSYTPNPLDQETGYKEPDSYRYSYTDYSYGAGWKVTDNLQLDFMGFAQLNDLTNWKLSAVFKF